jgi:hypothetical protein
MVSDRERRQRRYDEAREIVAAYAEDRDADLYNLIDESVRTDAMAIAYALARLAAAAATRAAETQGVALDDVLRDLATAD